MSPLRIAFLLPGLGRVNRGAETAFLELASGLSRFPDLQVTTVGMGTDVPPSLQHLAIPSPSRQRFEKFPRIPFFRSETHYEEFCFAARVLCSPSFRRAHFDVAITCSFPFLNGMLRWGWGKKPLTIFVTQNGHWPCLRKNREYRLFACDGLVCTNPQYFELLKQHYTSCLIPNGIRPERFNTSFEILQRRRAADPLTERPVILMVSALSESKRVLDGIRAVALVPNAQLVIAGDGPLREQVRDLAVELLPGRCRLLGSVPRDEMPALYGSADLFLHMSQDEPFGIVYLEAAAAGLPIVAHDGPIPRWILGDTALFADTSHPAAVAAAVKISLHTQTARDLGTQARRRIITDWTWNHVADRYHEFIHQVVQSRRPARPENNTSSPASIRKLTPRPQESPAAASSE